MFNLDEITKIVSKAGYVKLSNGATDEEKFLFLYALNHYFYGDSDEIYKVIDGCHYDKSTDNYAQGFFESDDIEKKALDVLIPYWVNEEKGETFDLTEALYRLKQFSSMIAQIKKKNFYSTAANNHALLDYWSPDSDLTINAIVVTNYKPTPEQKINAISEIDSERFLGIDMTAEIVFGDDIEEEIYQSSSDVSCVDDGYLMLDKENNFLTYGNENSLIVNICASSLADNFKKYGKSGLLAMNLRYYIPNKKVDNDLTDSILRKGQDFWYLNNGIIIVCDDYKIDGKKLILKNWSIVNGGQTTRMIGTIPFKNDFVVSCKVIKNKYPLDSDESLSFVSSVAEASNSQKPIKSADIIANRVEQRKLKSKFASEGLFLQVKRGEATKKAIKEKYPMDYQRTDNQELAQLIYSLVYQKPGTARNNKNSLFTNEETYQKIFVAHDYNIDLLKDILFLKSAYVIWEKKISKSEYIDSTKKGLVKNGKYFILAATFLLFKLHYSPKMLEILKNNDANAPENEKIFSDLSFNHRIFSGSFEDVKDKIINIFEYTYDNFLSLAFSELKEAKPETSYSNFTKINKNYTERMTRILLRSIKFNRLGDDFTYLFTECAYMTTEEERGEDDKLFNLILNNDDTSEENDETFVDENIRTRIVALAESLKVQEGKTVLTQAEINGIVKERPCSTDDLFKCLKTDAKRKIWKYGDKIIEEVLVALK